MKKVYIFIALVLAFYFLKPFFTPPADSIQKCLNSTQPQSGSLEEQLKYSELSFQTCKYALELNAKKYTDKNWINMSAADIASPELLANPQKMSNIKESIGILDKITLYGMMSAGIFTNKMGDRHDAIRILKETKEIVSKYKFYDETSQSSLMIERNIQSISPGQ